MFAPPAHRILLHVMVGQAPAIAYNTQPSNDEVRFMSLTQSELKHLRAIGHKLNPVVMIAEKGVSDGVAAELERALNDHELIKIKLAINDRDAKQAVLEQLCASHKATLVQVIGKVALLLRRAPKPNPKLSNLLRNMQ